MREPKKTVTMEINGFMNRVMEELGYPPNPFDTTYSPEMEEYMRKVIRADFENTLDNKALIYHTGKELEKIFNIKP